MSTRTPKPTLIATLTLDDWQRDPERVRWAKQDARLVEAECVMRAEMERVVVLSDKLVQAQAFGRLEGYLMCLNVLRALRERPARTAPPVEEDLPPHRTLTDPVHD